MSGALKELGSKDIQDSRYTINPQVTFFKTVYQRHTNFAMETADMNFNKNMTFGSTDTIDISKYGADLVYKMYIKIKIKEVNPNGSNFAWIKRLGHAIINRVTIRCGGTEYDSHYGTWLDVWNELSGSINQQNSYDKLIGDVDELTDYNDKIKPEYVLMIPLIFWFNQNSTSAFPIISSRLSQFMITLQLSKKESLFIRDDNFDDDKLIISDISLLTTFIYLDTKERNIFIKKPQEYLMDKIECNGTERVESEISNFTVSFNRPHRELIWCMKNGNYTTGEKFIYYSNKKDWTKKINGGLSPLEDVACKIIKESIEFSDPDIDLLVGEERTWIELDTGNNYVVGSINIINSSNNKIWYKEHTIGYLNANNNIVYLNDKISLDVNVSPTTMTFSNVKTTLSVYDISFPVKLMKDFRINKNDPIVYQFNNYGILIDGSINPFIDCGIMFDGLSRVDVQTSDYFGIVQHFEKHKKIAKTGICIYSFSLNPEEHQPSGTDDLSKIDKVILSTTLKKYPELNFLKSTNECWIFGRSITLMRFIDGRSGLVNK